MHLLQAAGLVSPEGVPRGQVGEDAVVKIVSDELAIVENVDVFTPIHDDPYTQGKIVACNATNDIFAMGVTKIISLQAFLAYPEELPLDVPAQVLRGMDDFMQGLGASVTGGQTIRNPCPVFGGVCLGVAHPSQIVHSNGAKVGDVVILTKPLGIQPAMRSYRDLQSEKRDALLSRFAIEELQRMQDVAVRIMTQSNLEVALSMQKIGVHAATDVTGFGLLGHANNVAKLSGVSIVFDKMPVIRGTLKLAEFFGHRLSQGLAAETAGGMLVFMDSRKAPAFSRDLKKRGLPSWTIGQAIEPAKEPSATLADGIQYIETEFP